MWLALGMKWSNPWFTVSVVRFKYSDKSNLCVEVAFLFFADDISGLFRESRTIKQAWIQRPQRFPSQALRANAKESRRDVTFRPQNTSICFRSNHFLIAIQDSPRTSHTKHMKSIFSTFGLPLVLTSILLASTGCVTRETQYAYPPPRVVVAQPGGPSEVVVAEPPPPPQVEYATAAPGPEFIWVSGVWVWEGGWVWHAGHWDHPPRPGARWVGPHYYFRHGRHVYVRGYWRY